MLESLLGVTSAKINHLLASGPAAQLSLYERRDLEAEYGARLKFLKSLLDPQVRDRAEDMDDMSLELDEEHVKVAYPTYLRTTPARQGPFLLQPAPRDLESDEDEPLASDMEYILVEPEATETNEGADFPLVGVLLMSYENGKVDVCVDVARVEASWSKQSSETVRRPVPWPSILP